MAREIVTIDGNTATSTVAHAVSEVIAIYPITPSSSMGELADAKSAAGDTNIWGTVPDVTEMQSEAGASGAIHGALTTGALVTTFTASQGLLLMIPNMYKIAGELLPTVFHVSARSLAIQALSIFADHSDVMAVRQTGFALLASNSVQEAMDMALIAHAATLESKIPFLHFFDGFRTSSEIRKVEMLSKDDMKAMIEDEYVFEHRARGMSPDNPVLRGTSQNPDVYFTGREVVNKYYEATPAIVQKYMDKFAQITGRQYHLFDYVGAPDAERVVVMMASAAETMHEVVNYLVEQGEKVGLLKVHLYRPFSVEHFVEALPETVKAIAVLDRTKEAGSIGEPLYLDVRAAIFEGMDSGWFACGDYPTIVGGRYGLGSHEFDAGMSKAVLDNLKQDKPKNHFTIGIYDDVTHTSLEWDKDFSSEPKSVHRAMFYGLGSDGTVGANKNSIKIIGKATDNNAQGYFVYDSKKAGAMTISHLRFGEQPIRSTYLIDRADFVGCHNFSFVEKYDVLEKAIEGATFLLNSPFDKDAVWDELPVEMQQQMIDKKIKFYIINAYDLATELGLGARINTIMQTAFFMISGVLPKEKALALIKQAVEDTYGSKGQKVVDMNFKAIEAAIENIVEVPVPDKATSTKHIQPPVPEDAPEFVQEVIGEIIAKRGEEIPVSKWPDDGTFPVGTTKYEKRNIAVEIPVWEPELCIQCGECSLVCPHAAIRIKVYDPKHLDDAPETFKSVDARGRSYKGMKFTVQVAPEDCTGCGLCVANCPGLERDENREPTGKHAINMAPQMPLREAEAENFDFFLDLPDWDVSELKLTRVKDSQLMPTLFEFSGACAGCGETPYVKLVTQLFGDRAIIANATGCSSIYGGNLPTTPYTTRDDGRGPTWNNSLFEDAAEIGLGMCLTVDKQTEFALELLEQVKVDAELVEAIKNADQSTQIGIEEQRERIAQLKELLKKDDSPAAKQLLTLANYLVKKSVWVFGGDGWAYDIGYGGLDHVLASGRDINVLVLDTEVYSNTGGQASKATPIGAVARFAEGGKRTGKKDLGMMAMTYGTVYVAKIAFGANKAQAVKAIYEAESYNGPSLVIANSHCIAHGINMTEGLTLQNLAVETGAWHLYRYDPRLKEEGKNPLQLDSKAPTRDLEEYMYQENRFRVLKKATPEVAAKLLEAAKKDIADRWALYEHWAQMEV